MKFIFSKAIKKYSFSAIFQRFCLWSKAVIHRMLFEISVFKNFCNIHKKYLCWSLFLIKLPVLNIMAGQRSLTVVKAFVTAKKLCRTVTMTATKEI